MRIIAAAAAFYAISATTAAAQDRPLPIIDMHLHALAANDQGPPPPALCAGALGAGHDPARSWSDAFMEQMKNPACSDPIWSPHTDEELMRRTLEILERRNVISVTSGALGLLQRWNAAAPTASCRPTR